MTTLFERIIQGEIPCEKVFENENIFAFKDIAPKAPVHILIVPKKVIPDLQSVNLEDLALMGEIVQVAQRLAREFDIEEDGYRLICNNGPFAGQTIYHLHFHLLGGAPLGRMAG